MTVTVVYTGDMKDDIDTAIAAASAGEEILVPNGTYNFDGTVTFNGHRIYAQTAYQVVFQQVKPTVLANPMFYIDGADAVLDGFKMEAYVKPGIASTDIENTDLVNGFKGVCISVQSATDFMIVDCAIEDFSSMAVWCNNSRGLIKRCYVWAPYKESIPGCQWAYGVVVTNSSYSSVTDIYDVAGRYEAATHPVVYIEDCVFGKDSAGTLGRLRHAVAHNQQGCYCIRHNTFYGSIPTNYQIIDMHGPAVSGMCEAYENVVDGLSQNNVSAFSFNGGFQLVYDNHIHSCGQAYTLGSISKMYYWDNTYSNNARLWYRTISDPIDYYDTRLLNTEYYYDAYVYPHSLSGEGVPSEAEVYAWLDAQAAIYGGTRSAPYLAAWGFTAAVYREAFKVDAWNQYTDVISSSQWLESGTYYQAFPLLSKTWNPSPTTPPIPPPVEPPEPEPEPEPPTPPPPETDPPSTPPPSNDPVEPPATVPPPPPPGIDLPVNPTITFASGESRMMGRILNILRKTRLLSLEELRCGMERKKPVSMKELIRILEKQGAV
jgi:hypothetical protein